jgi:squalene-hopene/tetraprenyl-beta-curcumene cyclase
VVVMAMDRTQKVRDNKNFQTAIDRGREWICGLQSQNGGWGAFDADNEYLYLNNIPFADHGALLDPPTEDVTGRCVSMLAQLGEASTMQVRDGIDYLRRTQLAKGTWSVLCALNAAGLQPDAPEIQQARDWLISIQNSDGGWGEDGTSYKLDYSGYENAPSTASQTAWALIGLMAAGAADHPAVAKGIDYLIATQGTDGLWAEERYTATGFPRVFYLRYHGYPKFFPLWALARYNNLRVGQSAVFGM